MIIPELDRFSSSSLEIAWITCSESPSNIIFLRPSSKPNNVAWRAPFASASRVLGKKRSFHPHNCYNFAFPVPDCNTNTNVALVLIYGNVSINLERIEGGSSHFWTKWLEGAGLLDLLVLLSFNCCKGSIDWWRTSFGCLNSHWKTKTFPLCQILLATTATSSSTSFSKSAHIPTNSSKKNLFGFVWNIGIKHLVKQDKTTKHEPLILSSHNKWDNLVFPTPSSQTSFD